LTWFGGKVKGVHGVIGIAYTPKLLWIAQILVSDEVKAIAFGNGNFYE
jgi:hypothetical protein